MPQGAKEVVNTMRRKYRAIGFSLIILAALRLSASARQDNLIPDLWLFRARRLTEELVKDADALGARDRALLSARLGEAWWREDAERARAWMRKAVEAVEGVPNRESAAERGRRLDTARRLLAVVAPKDTALRARLLSVFTAEAGRSDAAENDGNAEALMQTALAVLKQDPPLAAELGAASLRAGYSAQIPELLWGLRARDPKFADALFGQALLAARASYHVELLNSLRYVAFTDFNSAPSRIPEPPDALRVELLKVYLEHVRRGAEAGGDQSSLCRSVAAFISPLLPHYERLLPQQAATVREVTTKCAAAANNPLARMRTGDALREQPLNTVEALLEAAAKTDDAVGRTSYRFRAAQMAAGQRDFKRAVEILDRIDGEARKVMGGMWEKWRTEWTVAVALENLKRDDLQGMHQVLNSAPTDLRPLLDIVFVQKLPAGESRVSAEEFIGKARQELGRVKLPDDERAVWYALLLKLYAKHVPLYAPGVLKEAVAAINRADRPGSAFDPDRGTGSAIAYDGAPEFPPASMLENDESLTLEIIGTIESPLSRSHARLSLLKTSLERHRKLADAGADKLDRTSNANQ